MPWLIERQLAILKSPCLFILFIFPCVNREYVVGEIQYGYEGTLFLHPPALNRFVRALTCRYKACLLNKPLGCYFNYRIVIFFSFLEKQFYFL